MLLSCAVTNLQPNSELNYFHTSAASSQIQTVHQRTNEKIKYHSRCWKYTSTLKKATKYKFYIVFKKVYLSTSIQLSTLVLLTITAVYIRPIQPVVPS
jgi:hypothetical protein